MGNFDRYKGGLAPYLSHGVSVGGFVFTSEVFFFGLVQCFFVVAFFVGSSAPNTQNQQNTDKTKNNQSPLAVANEGGVQSVPVVGRQHEDLAERAAHPVQRVQHTAERDVGALGSLTA